MYSLPFSSFFPSMKHEKLVCVGLYHPSTCDHKKYEIQNVHYKKREKGLLNIGVRWAYTLPTQISLILLRKKSIYYQGLFHHFQPRWTYAISQKMSCSSFFDKILLGRYFIMIPIMLTTYLSLAEQMINDDSEPLIPAKVQLLLLF